MRTQLRPVAVPGEHIVVFRPGISRSEQHALLASLAPQSMQDLPLVNGVLVGLDPSRRDLNGLTPELQSAIRYSQPNYYQSLRGGEGVPTGVVDTPSVATAPVAGELNDPEYARQYHLENTGQAGGVAGADIKAQAAWRMSRGQGVIVAVADTNIDIAHPDLAPNIWRNTREVAGNGVDDDGNGYVDDVNGWNFGRESNRPQDGGNAHGTHVAGIIASAQGNGVGGSGVAPDAKIMPLAILTSSATTANAIRAFDYAVKNGAHIISNSWGNNRYEQALADAVAATTAAGVSVVVAAGNENWDTGINGSYPDNYAGSLSVAASTSADTKAVYSNRGTITIDVAAPGDQVVSTLPGSKYGALSGTSMAAPVVSGLMALVKARYPELSMREVEQRVLRSVETNGAAQVWNTLVATGGRVDAEAALTPIAQPGKATSTDGAVVGSPVRLDWTTNIAEGQRFEVEVSSNPAAIARVEESFDTGVANRAFRTSGDAKWSINNAVAQRGTHSFNVDKLAGNAQSRLELTETITQPTEVSFQYRGGKGGELSFFINRDLQFQPTRNEQWQEFRTTLQPGTYTFTWLAAGKGTQLSPVAIDDLRIDNVSDATWTRVGETQPGSTGIFWTPSAATPGAAARVRAHNGRFAGDWVIGDPFEVVAKKGS